MLLRVMRLDMMEPRQSVSPICAAGKLRDLSKGAYCSSLMVEEAKTPILVVDDEETLRHMLSLLLDKHGFSVTTAKSADDALERLRAGDIRLLLSDVRMPEHDGRWLLARVAEEKLDVAVVMMSAYVDQDVAVQCLKLGARDYISKPFKPDEVTHKLRLAHEWITLESQQRALERENQRLRGELQLQVGAGGIVGQSQKIREVMALIGKIAGYKSTVLLLGESGTGKELVAKLIHARSPRKEAPFIAINCAAIPEALLESELFGYVKGAFTDANRTKPGLVEEADKGTLFLDEVGDLPLMLQVKLLRFLQEEEFRRVGDTKSMRVDVRVIAATARDLTSMVADGSFREDLYYRLNVLQVTIPPLRERKDDIPPLSDHFIEKYRDRLRRNITGLTPDARRALLAYEWPGNVRELENAIEQAMVLSDTDTIGAESLPQKIARAPAPASGRDRVIDLLEPENLSIKQAVRSIELHLIKKALEKTGGNRTRAAEHLEISHRALLYKIKEYGIS
jgi:two-component system, NtrC family, response regulator AtoC